FLRDRVLVPARPKGQEGGVDHDLTLRAALDAAEPGIAAEFASAPRVEAEVRKTLGASYLYLGEAAAAARQFERELALREAARGRDDSSALAAMNNLADAYRLDGRYPEAITLYKRDLDLSLEKLGPDHPDTLKSMSGLAVTYRLAGRL